MFDRFYIRETQDAYITHRFWLYRWHDTGPVVAELIDIFRTRREAEEAIETRRAQR